MKKIYTWILFFALLAIAIPLQLGLKDWIKDWIKGDSNKLESPTSQSQQLKEDSTTSVSKSSNQINSNTSINILPEFINDKVIDKNSGQIISRESISAYSGECLAQLTALKERSPTDFQENFESKFDEKQSAWIGSQVNRGKRITKSLTALPQDMPTINVLFLGIYNKTITQEDAEWYLAFRIIREGSKDIDRTTIGLAYMHSCGNAGFISKI